jgi:excisionase family DNA binding protein
MDNLFTTEDLVRLLRVSPRTIHRERNEKKLKFIKIRGRIRYREEDVREYLLQQYPEEVVRHTLGL